MLHRASRAVAGRAIGWLALVLVTMGGLGVARASGPLEQSAEFFAQGRFEIDALSLGEPAKSQRLRAAGWRADAGSRDERYCRRLDPGSAAEARACVTLREESVVELTVETRYRLASEVPAALRAAEERWRERWGGPQVSGGNPVVWKRTVGRVRVRVEVARRPGQLVTERMVLVLPARKEPGVGSRS